VDVGKLVQQLDHTVIVFESVQANPGQTVFRGNEVFIKGLMLVPEDDDAKDRHRRTLWIQSKRAKEASLALPAKRSFLCFRFGTRVFMG
jgi:hypothetical protein